MLGLISSYFRWHYSQALSDIWRQWRNFVWFLYNFFSISLLSKTLFAPWQRLEEHYRGGLHPGEMGTVVAVNLIMRLVGFFIRVFVILFGLTVLLFTIFLGLLWLILWILSPLILLILLGSGFHLLFI